MLLQMPSMRPRMAKQPCAVAAGRTFSFPYQRGSRPLAFDLVEITDDEEDSLSGKISGECCCPHTKRNRKKKYR